MEQGHDAVKELLLAAAAYRAGAGRWPASPMALREDPLVAAMIAWDRYEGLTFTIHPNGSWTAAFDRWVSEDGQTVMEEGVVTLHPSESR